MIFWIVAGALALMAAAFIVAPLLRGAGEQVNRAEGALAIFADQIAEVDREAARGLISAEEAEAAKVEIKRRMLAVARNEGAAETRRGGAGFVLMLALGVPVVGAGVYWQLGSPGMPSLPYAERTTEREESAEINRLTSELRQRLEAEPNGGEMEGWVILGQTYMRLNRYGDAALAFGRVVDRPDATAGILTQFAEALIAAEDGIVTNRAVVVIERAREMDPDNPAGTFYWAQWLMQEGRDTEAEAVLSDRVGRETAFAPWMRVYVQQINRLRERRGEAPAMIEDFLTAGPGPSQEDMQAAAEMSAEEREAMVVSMVEGLAARLEESPDDLDGWLRLARSYGVLERPEEALAAFERAAGLLEGLSEDDPRRAAVAAGLATFGGN